MKYIITVGLPGSGKSTWCEKYRESKSTRVAFSCNRYDTTIIECDNYYQREYKLYDCLEEYVYDKICPLRFREINTILIDGLFTTTTDITKLLSYISPDLFNSEDELVIMQWEENREQCVLNDLYRRNNDSKITINNLPYEDIDLEKIRDVVNIKVSKEYKSVFKKPNYLIFADKYNLYLQQGYLCSNTWSGGGTWGNCWGGSGTIYAEDPCEFTELDELLEKVCPSITFLQYKKITNACIETDEYYDSDYYGGSQIIHYYKCDLEHLYDFLLDMNVIDENELLEV